MDNFLIFVCRGDASGSKTEICHGSVGKQWKTGQITKIFKWIFLCWDVQMIRSNPIHSHAEQQTINKFVPEQFERINQRY